MAHLLLGQRACMHVQSLSVSDSLQACRPSGSFVHGTSQARILEWVAISYSGRIFPTQGSNPYLLYCRWIFFFYHQATWEALGQHSKPFKPWDTKMSQIHLRLQLVSLLVFIILTSVAHIGNCLNSSSGMEFL